MSVCTIIFSRISRVFIDFSQECLCVAFAPVLQKTRAIVAPPTNEKGNPPGESMAAGYSDGSVRVFSSESERWSERKMKPHGSPVTKLTFSADGQSDPVCAWY